MVKLFNRWSWNVEVLDPGLKKYINLKPIIYPDLSRGRHVKNWFGKANVNIVERLINKMQGPGHKGKKHWFSSGHLTGKKMRLTKIVYEAFEIIERKTKKNPIEILVRAIENAAPNEEVTNIEYAGARYPKAVDMSPQRRVDVALRNIVFGAFSRSIKNKKKASEILAEEIIKAYKNDPSSFAISKKHELHRTADSSR